jgi:creatinine amidohydrolase/Fe(II)-dependent formamide hydrolase-like protein
LKQQGFLKIVVIAGHNCANQTEVLNRISEIDDVLSIDPYEPVSIRHADEGEISVLWACYPEEEEKARSMERDVDLINYYGHDPIEKSSLEYGKGLLKEMLKSAKEKVKDFLKGKNDHK